MPNVRMLPNQKRVGTPHADFHDRTIACVAPPRCERKPPDCHSMCGSPYLGNSHHPDCERAEWEAEWLGLRGAQDLHTAKVAGDGGKLHRWHAWISDRPEVGVGETESEAIESLGHIHAAIDCGFCGKNLTECECPNPM